MASACALRDCIDTMVPDYDITVTGMVVTDHRLDVEQHRRWVPPIPRERWVYPFCRLGTTMKDEPHVFLECEDGRTTGLRTDFPLLAFRKDHPVLHLRRHSGASIYS